MYVCLPHCSEPDFDNIKMHVMTVKIIEAQQARLCTSYKNTKLKLLKEMPQYESQVPNSAADIHQKGMITYAATPPD